MNLNDILNNARNKQKEEDNDYSQETLQHLRESKKRKAVFYEQIHDKMHGATKADYMHWLRGFLENGGIITHVYDYQMDLRHWIIVKYDFEISPLYGSESYNIIVPNGVKLNGGDKGHSNIYFMDDFLIKGTFVPLYSDIIFGSDCMTTDPLNKSKSRWCKHE